MTPLRATYSIQSPNVSKSLLYFRHCGRPSEDPENQKKNATPDLQMLRKLKERFANGHVTVIGHHDQQESLNASKRTKTEELSGTFIE